MACKSLPDTNLVSFPTLYTYRRRSEAGVIETYCLPGEAATQAEAAAVVVWGGGKILPFLPFSRSFSPFLFTLSPFLPLLSPPFFNNPLSLSPFLIHHSLTHTLTHPHPRHSSIRPFPLRTFAKYVHFVVGETDVEDFVNETKKK